MEANEEVDGDVCAVCGGEGATKKCNSCTTQRLHQRQQNEENVAVQVLPRLKGLCRNSYFLARPFSVEVLYQVQEKF